MAPLQLLFCDACPERITVLVQTISSCHWKAGEPESLSWGYGGTGVTQSPSYSYILYVGFLLQFRAQIKRLRWPLQNTLLCFFNSFCVDLEWLVLLKTLSRVRTTSHNTAPKHHWSTTIFYSGQEVLLLFYSVPFWCQTCWSCAWTKCLILDSFDHNIHDAICSDTWWSADAGYCEMLSGRTSFLQCLQTAACYEL